MEQCCPSCGKQYEGKGGPGGRLPVIFPCLCRFCKVCALKEEAAAQQQPVRTKKGKGKGKGDKQKPTPCLNCKTPCAIPVSNLLLDEALLNEIAGAVGGKVAPVCDVCDEEEATKHCGDCKKNQFFCDHCFAHVHRSAKNQGHTPTPIQDHLASTASASASGGGSAAPKMCSIHTDEVLKFFCDDCQVLVCATCAVLHHNGHTLKPIGGAVQQHRGEIEAAATCAATGCADTTSTIKSLRQVKAKLDSNRDIAKQNIIAGFRKVSQASLSQSKAFCKRVDEVHKEKSDAVDAQIFALEAAETRSEGAVALARSTLHGATAEQVLRMKKLFVDGLAQVKDHGLALEQCRAATIEVILSRKFDEAVAEMAELMQLNVGNTNPAASIAFGEGVETAHAGTGKVAEFVVTAIEFGTGKQSTAGGDDVAVRVAPKDGGSGGGGGGGGAAAAAPAKDGKRKRGGSGGGAANASKKSKTGAAASSATGGNGGVFEEIVGAAVDNGNGTYSCSYTLPDGAEEQEWALEVLLNGEHVVGSPFALNVEAAATSLGGVEIKGAAGLHSARVNGMYEKVEEMQNGKPVYIKVGSSGMVCCWYGPNGQWLVSTTTDKDANKYAGFAYSIAAGLAAPELAARWKMSLGGGKWEVQPAVTVAFLSGAEVHAAKVAADAAAAAAVAASGFTIAGATGNNAHKVNGAFSKTSAMQNGKPVYSKDGDADIWCYCGSKGKWRVAKTANKDANKGRGWATSFEIGLAAPHLTKAWEVSVSGTFVLQPAVNSIYFLQKN
eukprot:gene19170-biopygen29354